MSLYIGSASDEARPLLSILSHTPAPASLALGFNFGLALTRTFTNTSFDYKIISLTIIIEENDIVSWGDDSYGQRSIPSLVEPRPHFVDSSCGWAHSLLLTGPTGYILDHFPI
jgi:hypothetical protein